MQSRRGFLAAICSGALLFTGSTSRIGESEEESSVIEGPDNSAVGTTETPEQSDDRTGEISQGSEPTSEPDERLDVRDFGADVDGVTDDTLAIRSAIDAAEEGDTLYFPPGKTVVSLNGTPWMAGILLDSERLPSNFTLQGEGEETVIQLAGEQNEIHSVIRLVGRESFDGLMIRDMKIDGNRAAQTGRGGHCILGFNSEGVKTPMDVLLHNVYVSNASQSGITFYRGGVSINHCTVRGCAKHGINFGIGTEWDESLPSKVVRNCFCTQNGKADAGNTYGINCSGGNILVQDSVLANNGQGTKTTEGSVNVTYRRVRLQNNDHLGYIRAGKPTDNRTQVIFDDVVATNNGGAGFRLSRDTDYVIPTEIVASENGDHNIIIRKNASIVAERIWANGANDSYGIYEDGELGGTVREYYHSDNGEGAIYGGDNLTIEQQTVENKSDLENVPRVFEVGASPSQFSSNGPAGVEIK